MIVRLSSVFVPRLSDVCREELRSWAINHYTAAPGLHSAQLFHRELVGYFELVTVSIWNTEEAMTAFFSENQSNRWNSEKAAIEREAVSYELIVSIGAQPEVESDPEPDLREGAD